MTEGQKKMFKVGNVVTDSEGRDYQILVITDKLVAFNTSDGLVFWATIEEFLAEIKSFRFAP